MNYEDINLQIDEILNGKRDLPQFNQPEHAGVCSAGSLLVGALIVCHNTRESFSAGGNAPGSKGTVPSNWQIDEAQEKAVTKMGFSVFFLRNHTSSVNVWQGKPR